MKLIYCSNCDSAFTPGGELKKCQCGNSVGKEVGNVVYYDGEYARPLSIDPVTFNVSSVVDVYAKKFDYVKEKQRLNESDKEFAVNVIKYLNEKATTAHSTHYPTNHTTLIIARRDEHKIGLGEFYRVIDNKVSQWKGTEYAIYLRPKTLFSKANFINYLGENHVNVNNKIQPKSFTSIINSTKESLFGSSQPDGQL